MRKFLGIRLATGIPLVAFLLGIQALFHLGRGFHSLVLDPDRALDLNMRFQEVHLFWRVPLVPEEPMPAGRMERWDWENYLPSSHILGLVYVPPFSWALARMHFAVLTAVALAALVIVGRRLGPPDGPGWWLLAPVVLACSNLQTSLAFGQYSILVAALLLASTWRTARGDTTGAVALLVLASVKPVLCVPFYALLFACRQWRVALPATTIVGLLLIAGFASSELPLPDHLATYAGRSGLSMDRGLGLNTLVMGAGLPAGAAKYLGLLLVAVGAVWVGRRWPRLPVTDPLAFAALAGLAGRGWFPAFGHDNVLLIPLLVWWSARAYRSPTPLAVATALGLGLTLWLPGRWMVLPAIALLQWGIWLFAATALTRALEVAAPAGGSARGGNG